MRSAVHQRGIRFQVVALSQPELPRIADPVLSKTKIAVRKPHHGAAQLVLRDGPEAVRCRCAYDWPRPGIGASIGEVSVTAGRSTAGPSRTTGHPWASNVGVGAEGRPDMIANPRSGTPAAIAALPRLSPAPACDAVVGGLSDAPLSSGECESGVNRRKVLECATGMGMLNPAAGSWTHPDKSQCLVGDSTWEPAATNLHRHQGLFLPNGKTRRFDPNAEYHHTRDGKPTKIPGRELVMLSTRSPYPNERLLIDAEFMAPKNSPRRKGRNDADQAVDMLERLLEENHDLLRGNPNNARRSGLKGFIFDMAMDSEAIDRVLANRILPIAKTPRTAGGKFRHGNLGPHEFILRDGSTETHDLKTCNGSVWVLLPNAHATEKAVPLRRSHFYWGDETKDGSIAYCKVAMPHDPDVPVPSGEPPPSCASTAPTSRSTPNPHTRRTRSLRPIPEADLDFEIFGAREDIESTFSDLKRRTRGRLRYLSEDRNRFNILSYMILRLSRTQSAYHERTTAAQAFPIAA